MLLPSTLSFRVPVVNHTLPAYALSATVGPCVRCLCVMSAVRCPAVTREVASPVRFSCHARCCPAPCCAVLSFHAPCPVCCLCGSLPAPARAATLRIAARASHPFSAAFSRPCPRWHCVRFFDRSLDGHFGRRVMSHVSRRVSAARALRLQNGALTATCSACLPCTACTVRSIVCMKPSAATVTCSAACSTFLVPSCLLCCSARAVGHCPAPAASSHVHAPGPSGAY